MQDVSALYHQILAMDNHWFETRVVIGDSGDLVTEHGDRIKFGEDTIVVSRTGPDSGFMENLIFGVSTDIEMFSNTPEIGKAISQECEVRMIHPAGDIPRMAVVIPYVRAVGSIETGTHAMRVSNTLRLSGHVSYDDETAIFSEGSNAVVQYVTLKFTNESGLVYSEWIQQGKFYIDTREITNNDDGLKIITLHGYDAMMMAEQDYADTALEWPAMDVDIVGEIAAALKTQVDPRTIDFMTAGYQLPLPTGYSMREILSIIAAKYLGCFIISDTGLLRLISLIDLPRETNLLIEEHGDYIIFGEDRILV